MKNSYFLGLLFEDSKLQAAFEKSLFYGIFTWICYGILGFFKWIFKKLDGYSSIFYKNICVPLFRHYHIVLGLCLTVMIITPHSKWSNSYGFILAAGLFALFCLNVILEKNVRFAPIRLPMVLFCIAVLVGVLISPLKAEGARVALFYFTAVLFALDIANGIKTQKQLKVLLCFLWLALMLTSLYAVYQGIVGVEVDLSLTDTELNAGMPGRVYSTFENPNNYAELIVMLVPFAAALALSEKKIWLRICLLGSLILPLGAIGLTLSRSGWLALGGAIVVFILLYKPVLILPLIGVGFLALPFLPDSIIRRAMTIGSMDDSSNKYRIYIWEGALRIIKEYGLTGIGLGPENFGVFYPSYANEMAINARHAHMLYLQSIIEMGVLGFVSVMWTVLGTMKNTFAAIKRKWASPLEKHTGIALISAMCGMGAMAFVEYIWYYPRVLFVFFACLGIGVAVINMVKSEEKKDEQ